MYQILILALGTNTETWFQSQTKLFWMAKKRTVMALNRPAAATLHSLHLARIHLQLKVAFIQKLRFVIQIYQSHPKKLS